MKTPPTFPGERRAERVEDGLYVSPATRNELAILALKEVHSPGSWDPRWDEAPIRDDRSLPTGAWVLWLDGKMAASGTIKSPSGATP